MKKILLITLITLFANGENITILDNGVKRVISMPTPKTPTFQARAVGIKKDGPGFIVAFKKGTKIDIDKFMKKYNLKLKKRLIIGYYIFINKSTLPDVKVMNKIMKENNITIKTIRPNWGFNNKPR